MKLEHLQQFAKLAAYDSLNKASQEMFISHQGLSKMIVSLEKSFNTTLIKRHKRGITLTDNGKYLVEKVQQILAIWENMDRAHKQLIAQKLSGTLILYTDTFTQANLLPKILLNFKQQSPHLTVQTVILDHNDEKWQTIKPFEIGLISFIETGKDMELPANYVRLKRQRIYLVGKEPPNGKRATLLINQRKFNIADKLLEQLAAFFDIFFLQTQFQCNLSLSSPATYTLAVVDDRSDFTDDVIFITLEPPLSIVTYAVFSETEDPINQTLQELLINWLIAVEGNE